MSMRVLVTGGTGTVGSAVVRRFVAEGCDVRGVARSDSSMARLRALGAIPIAGDIERPAELAGAIRDADVVVHAAYTFAHNAWAADLSLIRRVGEELGGTGKPFVYTSGLWILGNVGPDPATEDARLNPPPSVRFRPAAEEMVLSLAARGVRSFVVRPGVVHGSGGGLLGDFVAMARREGVVRFVGTGDEYWPMVHETDLGTLYWLVAEKAEPGTIWHGVAEEGVLLRELALAAADVAGRPGCIAPWPIEAARQELGDFADALALDQRVSGARAHRLLGWTPTGPTALEDLLLSYAS